MSLSLGGIITTLGNALTKPIGARNCPPGWINGSEESSAKMICYPDPKTNQALYIAFKDGKISVINPNAPPEDQVWGLESRLAPIYNSNSGCPFNTFELNGTCVPSCRAGTEPRTFTTGERDASGALQIEIECRASCKSQDWHDLNWGRNTGSTTDGIPLLQKTGFSYRVKGPVPETNIQSQAPVTDRCFKRFDEMPATATDNFSEDWPLGVKTYTAQTGQTIGVGTNRFTVEFGGRYGEKAASTIGKPFIAGDCPPPNVATDSQCLKPPPKGYHIVGNQLVTDYACPAQFSTVSSLDPKQCIPATQYRKSYGSLLDYLIGLVVAILVIVLLGRFLRR